MFFRRKEKITWPAMIKRVREEFAEVPQISCEELASRLTTDSGGPILLDVRDADEFEISHLKSARHVPPKSDPKVLLAGVALNQPIVAYCASGVRSSRFSRLLIKEGFTNVANLEGSIFMWANQGRPIEANGVPANKVHACGEDWQELLNPELRVLPPEGE